MVQFLEGIAVEIAERHVLHDRDNRHEAVSASARAGHQQGGGRAVLGGDHRDLVRDPGICVGHDGAGIFRTVCQSG